MAPEPPSHFQERGWVLDRTFASSPSADFHVRRRGATLLIELARPERRNTLTSGAVSGLRNLYERVAKDVSVFRIILTGQGDVFCAGMDLGASGSATSASAETHKAQLRTFCALLGAIENSPQTTVALINGSCYGGGNGLAFANDIRICTKNATFNLTEVRLGLAPCAISPCLMREWGIALCRAAMLTARPVTAGELHRIGALYGVAADQAQLLAETLESIEGTLQPCAPGASFTCKELAKAAWVDPGGREQSAVVESRYLEMMTSSEAKHGIEQFRKGVRKVDWAKLPLGGGGGEKSRL